MLFNREMSSEGTFADIVILQILPRGDAQRAIAYFIRQLVQFQVLRRRQPPARISTSDHGAEGVPGCCLHM